jgi:hypothetical protein
MKCGLRDAGNRLEPLNLDRGAKQLLREVPLRRAIRHPRPGRSGEARAAYQAFWGIVAIRPLCR